jgi:FAD/FMN-containing dehydrogenase
MAAADPCTPFPGARVLPKDPRYDALCRGFNQRFAGKPAYIEVCGTAEQVRQAVQLAVDHSLRVTVRCGGHCYEGFVSHNDGGVIIDLSPLRGVGKDRDGLYCVEGGCTLWDVYVQLYRRYGVTLPGGTCYSVGVGGHVPGGGYGALSRKFGLTIDYLFAVELVHVTRQGKAAIVTARRDAAQEAERELLWAHQGGGGGNFGVATRFWFKDLPAAPAQAYLVDLAWDWADINRDGFRHLVGEYGKFFAENSGVDSAYKDLFAELHLNHRAARQIGLLALTVGKEAAAVEALVDRIKPPGVRVPAAKPYGRWLPWIEAAQTMNPSGANRRAKHKGAFQNRPFPAAQVDVLWDFLTSDKYHNAVAGVQIDAYGCQINAVAADRTAMPHRSSVLLLQYMAHWANAKGAAQTGDGDDTNLEWLRKFYTAMYGERGPLPDGTVDGSYVNFPDTDLRDWQKLYYKDNYARLQQVKKRWDSANVFRHAQSIEMPQD